MRILIVEDEQRIAENIKTMLIQDHYVVDLAFDAQTGLQKALGEDYDLIILDWMLRAQSGLDICRTLRRADVATPILMLTARSQLDDKLSGLDSGADDYLTKPFAMPELMARVRALLRRPAVAQANPILVIADLSIDTNTQVVNRGGDSIALSPREYALLEYLARHKNQVIDRLQLLSHVWDAQTDAFSNTVDVHIRYLRKKIDDPHHRKLIKTVKGKGYMLCDD